MSDIGDQIERGSDGPEWERIEKLRTKLRAQTQQTQETAQQIHDAILDTFSRHGGLIAIQEPQGHPIEQIVGTELAVRNCRIEELEAENSSLKDKILRFGNNEAGFDWAVLRKIDQLESENKRLRECETCGLIGGEGCTGQRCDECYSELQAESQRRLDLLREIWQSDDVSWVSHYSETFRKLAKEVGE